MVEKPKPGSFSESAKPPMMLPPGMSMLPVMAMSAITQWAICWPLAFWSVARPQAMDAGLALAYMRAAAMMSSSGTSQMTAALAGGMACTRSASWSKP